MQFNDFNNSHNARIEEANELLLDFVQEAQQAYTIPNSAFSSYRVKRGLREADGTGVTAGVTRIGNAHGYVIDEGEKVPDEGVLEYRGYDITKLIESYASDGRYGFEECAYLLFFGKLPSPAELAKFNALLDAYRRLPPRYTERKLAICQKFLPHSEPSGC